MAKNIHLRGPALVRLDGKGRMAIPGRHRDALAAASDGGLIVTAHPHGFLMLFGRGDFEKMEKEVMARPSFEINALYFQETIIGYAEELPIDSAGRVLLSAELREFAGIGRAVLMMGQRNRFHLWDSEKRRSVDEKIRRGETLAGPMLPPGWEDLII